MKSWGERLFGGLKKWRSQKSDISADSKPSHQSGFEQDIEKNECEPQEKLPAERTVQDSKGAEIGTDLHSTSKAPGEEANKDEQKSVQPSGSTVPTKQEKVTEFPSVTSKTRQMSPRLKPQQAKDEEKEQRINASREKSSSMSAISDKQRMIAKSISSPDHSSASSELFKDIAQETHVTGREASPMAATESANVAVATDKQLPEKLSIAEEANSQEETRRQVQSATPTKFARLRPQLGTKNSDDGLVTDSELAELEAENARLKSLILERSNGRVNNS